MIIKELFNHICPLTGCFRKVNIKRKIISDNSKCFEVNKTGQLDGMMGEKEKVTSSLQ